MKPVRVLLVDDHALVRGGIQSLLQKQPHIEIVGEAGSAPAALDLIAAHQPDVVLMDIMMPGMSGLDALERIGAAFPGVRVIILSMHSSKEYVGRVLAAGAAGFLSKGAELAELDLAIQAAMRGEIYLSPAIASQVVGDYLRHTHDQVALTGRQREILRLIGLGYTTAQIAHSLGVSVKTVESHRTQLMDRLGIHDIAGLVRYAIRIGLIQPDD